MRLPTLFFLPLIMSLLVAQGADDKVIMTDSFKLDARLRTAGKPLDGTLTMGGNQTWKASPAVVVDEDSFSFAAVAGNPGPVQASVELDRDAIAAAKTLKLAATADLPKRDATSGRMLGVGFARAEDTISVNGSLWLCFGLDGHWALIHYDQILGEGDISLEPGEVTFEIIWDQLNGLATLRINGEKVVTDAVVPAEHINHAIVHFQFCDDKIVKLKALEISTGE